MHIISIQIVASHCFDLHTPGDCGLIYNVFYRVCRTNFDIFRRKGGYTLLERQLEIDREKREREEKRGSDSRKKQNPSRHKREGDGIKKNETECE